MQTEKIKRAVSLVMVAVDFSDEISGADCLLFKNGYVNAFNGKIYIGCSVDVEDEFIVKAADMKTLLGRIKSKKVKLKVKKKSIVMSGGRVKGEMLIPYVDNMFELPKTPDKKRWKDLPEDFSEALSLCVISASTDYSFPFLCNVFVDGDGMRSSDDHRAGYYKMRGNMDTVIIPTEASYELSKIGKLKRYAKVKDGVFFSNDDLVFFTANSTKEKDYPQDMSFFDFKGRTIKLPDKLSEAVETAASFSEADFEIDRRVSIKITKDKIICKGEKNGAWVRHSLKYKYKGDDLLLNVNPTFMLQILKVTNRMKVGEGVAMFKTKNFKHIMSVK